MCTVNADVSTALRLGVTYTHRVAKYGSLVGRHLVDELRGAADGGGSVDILSAGEKVAGLSEEVGRVEGFFGWGVAEVPREAVQEVACKVTGDLKGDLGRCKSCLGGKGKGTPGTLTVDRVVEVPMELSYKWPRTPTARANRTLERFLRENSGDNVVFHMPMAMCDKSPAYSRFDRRSRSWFYGKYWDAHGGYGSRDGGARMRIGGLVRLYRESWGGTLRIPGVPRRGTLDRLREYELTIAVHARRGDFFKVGRPMVATKQFVRVIRRVMKEVVDRNDSWSEMPVAVNVYSEGRPLKGLGEGVGHDVNRLTRDYHDADGRVMNQSEVARMLRKGDGDGLGNVFRNGLRVELRVSQDTLLCLHEMVASDIFVGSMSGMSLHLVGSLSRGAMQLLPERIEQPDEWYGHVKFGKDGRVAGRDLRLVKEYWTAYAAANEDSARRALEQYMRASHL